MEQSSILFCVDLVVLGVSWHRAVPLPAPSLLLPWRTVHVMVAARSLGHGAPPCMAPTELQLLGLEEPLEMVWSKPLLKASPLPGL